MKVKRSELLSALKAVMPGVATKELVEQSSSVAFINNQLVSYNDEISVSHPFRINMEGAVPAKELLGIANKAKTEELDFTVAGNELQIKSGKSRWNLRIEKEIHFLLDSIGNPSEWYALPKLFCAAINFCLFTVSKDESTPVLTCVHVFDNYVETSDNQRITRYDMKEDGCFESPLLIPSVAAKELVGFKPTEYSITEGWLHFINDSDVMFSFRYFEENYPELDEWLHCDGPVVEFPKTINEILDRADVLSDGERVGVILEDDVLVITTENTSGWFEEECDISYSGPPIEFDIQPQFMKEIIKIKNTATVGERILRFETEYFQHIVWLMEPKTKK